MVDDRVGGGGGPGQVEAVPLPALGLPHDLGPGRLAYDGDDGDSSVNRILLSIPKYFFLSSLLYLIVLSYFFFRKQL